MLPVIKSHFLLSLYVFLLWRTAHAFSVKHPNDALDKRQTAATTPLVDFQVSEPVLTPSGTSDQYGCIHAQTLVSYVFENSYGHPFVGEYTPPPCDFNRVNINLTITSHGRQFDRLGIVYLGDVEVFRTSTAEPTASGIFYTYVKETSQYNALWMKDQKVIFDLGNIVDKTYTGPYYTTLEATFFTIPESQPTADTVLPISAQQSSKDMGSAFSVPAQVASVSYTLPQNVERAVISLSACGQATEEFWYTNTFSSDVNTFESTAGTLYGFSPFREVQLLIDGSLAGVHWPFPIIFTGGIVPGFWRPIVGIDAFDLRQHEIDVTPWLPLLCDGASHTFEIRVIGLDDDGASQASLSENVGSYWVVTGTIFLFLGEDESVTSGTSPSIDNPVPEIQISSSITTDTTGANATLTYNTAVSRDISITSTIKTSTGSRKASWTQSLSYSNFNSLTEEGFVQLTIQNTTGSDLSSSRYANTYSYPLNVNSSFSIDAAGEVGINGTLTRGLDYNIYGPSVFPSGIQSFNSTDPSTFTPEGALTDQTIQLPATLPRFSGSLLSTTQSGTAEYFSGAANNSYSFGTTTQDFDFRGAEIDDPSQTYELYHRHVKAVNATITEDEQTIVGEAVRVPVAVVQAVEDNVPVDALEGYTVRALLGRGPGQPKAGFLGAGVP